MDPHKCYDPHLTGKFYQKRININKNGKIEAVGRYIKTPKDAFEINLNGAHVYAGFIESWLETGLNKESLKSTRKHWDSKVRPENRSVDNLDIKNKAIKELRSLGFTTAHLAPKHGIFQRSIWNN